jgi:hypothetical protein
MFVNRTRGVVWATVSVLGLSACSTPAQKTDLRPDGPPDLLAVLVMDDAAFGLAESATFCKTGDNFRPGLVGTPDGVQHQICPDDLSQNVPELTDANPSNWYVRLEFDELLDPNIEELVDITDPDTGMPTGVQMGTLKNTQPVTLQCQSVNGGTLVDVPYDGYYSPAGNKLTWPVGPSLVIVPSFPSLVATQSECQITLKDNITDKDGNKVPTDERGPFKFKIAPVSIVAADTTPADGDMVDALTAGVDVTFNTAIDGSTLAWAFDPDPGNDYDLPESDTEFFMGADFEVNGMYTWSIPAGTMITDQCGKQTTFGDPSVDDGTKVGFATNDLTFVGITPFDGQMNAKPSSKIKLAFNQYMNPTTLTTTEWSLSPAVTGAKAYYDTGYNLIIDGALKPSTAYTFTLNNGATIDDCPGGEFAFGGCGAPSTMGGTFTNSAGDQVVHFTTAALAMTGTDPADNDTVTLDPSSTPVANGVKIDLTFNFDANPASLAATEWSISPSAGTWTVTNKPIPAPQTDPSAVKNVIELASTAAVPPGDYTFTLKGTASIDDTEATPSSFTPGQDVVIHFTVAAAPPSSAGPACY